ncbi:hypothetical protein GCM10010156_70650 [Planobispora rosea]|uniref:HD/PDEase domain-containing protein n=1 Tax=Planobispora rosea TaxID=35762 RepID=A0A8J3SB77_PLARO|nr:HD domain-containing protein [Planobispora rosea]GGT02513.1 hypothetical protein GCM10010156_70650 [Planobispora rosea]GIH88524.1 hypothetical protein Pro02_69320 [Planobispora rosea]
MTESAGITHHLDPLLRVLPPSLTAHQRQLVERAYTVAAYWHRGRRRRSGDPYITHPVAVAVILAELGMDHEMLCAALLHDVLDDTGCPESELVSEFGERITGLLAGLRTLDGSDLRTDDWESSADDRVLVLKLVDRLHNHRTMRFLPPEKQRATSQETLDVLVPLAVRLGLEQVGEELQRLAAARPAPPPDQAGIRTSFRTIAVGALLLPPGDRARWLEEWLDHLHGLPDGRARRRFTVQLLMGMPRLAVILRWPLSEPAHLTAQVLRRVARWVISSNVRTWSLLTPFLVWMTVEAAASSPWEAAGLLVTVPPVLGAGVRTLRERLHVAEGRPRHRRE